MATELNCDVNEMEKNTISSQLDNEKLLENLTQNGCSKQEDSESDTVQKEWGYALPELYKLVVKFYKDQSGKAVQLTYSERCNLVALSQQVTHGPYDGNTAAGQTLGFMDVVGKDRRVAWQALGQLTCSEAKLQFIHELHRLAPTLKPHIEACWADYIHQQEMEKERIEEEQIEKEREQETQLQRQKEENERRQQEQTKRDIQTALNQQTFPQFRTYAEHQFPGNPEQQGVLIRQLQDQHYEQYMQQVYQQQLQRQQQQAYQHQQEQLQEPQQVAADVVEVTDNTALTVADGEACTMQAEEKEGDQDNEDDGSNGSIATAAMWTRRDVKEFKGAVQEEGPNTVLRVGHGETVTVRVPTHQDGSCLFWEFATDAYDIGFGLYFEWSTDHDEAVTVHVTESDDDDEDDDDDDDDEEFYAGSETADDVERGSGDADKSKPSPTQTVIIPVYRRDCHEEVYAGSHTYPGTGVYLLKFDNSYSVWRSKTLYYRVYYTQ